MLYITCTKTQEMPKIEKDHKIKIINLQNRCSRWYLHRLVINEEFNQFLLRLTECSMKADNAESPTCQACGPCDR